MPLGAAAPLVALPLEVVQALTKLVLADLDLAKELLNARDGGVSGRELCRQILGWRRELG
jgi:hypothetical protein